MKRSELVEKQVIRANNMLNIDTITQKEKAVVCCMIEALLMDAKCYKGFNYIYWMDKGYDEWVADGKPENNKKYLGEEYNRHYY